MTYSAQLAQIQYQTTWSSTKQPLGPKQLLLWPGRIKYALHYILWLQP